MGYGIEGSGPGGFCGHKLWNFQGIISIVNVLLALNPKPSIVL